MSSPFSRRSFLKTSLATIGASHSMGIIPFLLSSCNSPTSMPQESIPQNLIGAYGSWATQLIYKDLPRLSLRQDTWSNIDDWRKQALERTKECMLIPYLGKAPKVKVDEKLSYDGLEIEKISWQLPYGPPTKAVLLKPANANEKLPGILAFHDHGGNKYFGRRKITRTSDEQHPMMSEHQSQYYSGLAWANEIAKKGYVVLVPDSFAFASRRVLLKDVPEIIKGNLADVDPEKEDKASINAYNQWAGDHEHILSKSLFSAGTTWPGVFFAEDKMALDILCSREDVDEENVGCGGLSGGGLRTAIMGGIDHRIKCAVCVGFMTTWMDLILNKSYTHTWMTYIPQLPHDLDFPEILGLRAPLPTLVLNDIEDQLFSLTEMKKADQILSKVYDKANAKENYRTSFYPGKHKFDEEMQAEAFDWFDQWLKK